MQLFKEVKQEKGLTFDPILKNVIKKLPAENAQRRQFFEEIFEKAVQDISDASLDFKIEQVIFDGNQRYQLIQLSFRAEEAYNDKKVEGYLVLPNDYPQTAPKFYFGFFKDNTKIIHENIYAGINLKYLDGLLCIPLLTNSWKPENELVDVFNAIKDIFIHPNLDDPANPIFAKNPEIEKQRRRKIQSETLEDWE